jgi:hypothetical protein
MPNTAYDQFKEHEGKRYTGMKIGRGHKSRPPFGHGISISCSPATIWLTESTD